MSRYVLRLGAVIFSVAAVCPAQEIKTSWGDYARRIANERLAAHAEAAKIDPTGVGDSTPTLHLANYLEEPAAESAAPETQPVEIERGPLPGFFETAKRDIKELPELLWRDTKAVYLNPWNVLFLVGAGGASLAVRPEADDDIEDYYWKHHSFSSGWRDSFSTIGNPGTHLAVAGLWYWAGQQMQDIKTYEVGKRMISALVITDLSTLLLKVAAYTDSPNGEGLAWPSGHVSSTMALATVLNDAYGPLVGVPMYGLTALVAVERLDDREHHFSDVIFGAALGWVIAETVMKEHRPEICGGAIVPYVDPYSGNAGVAWFKTFGD